MKKPSSYICFEVKNEGGILYILFHCISIVCCSYTWDVPLTVVTALSDVADWNALPVAWIDIGETGQGI